MKYINQHPLWLVPIVLLLSIVLAACLPTKPPAPIPSVISVATVTDFESALASAATAPNTTIRLTADIVETDDVLYLRGNGTTLDLNGHTVTYANSFTGLNHGGCGIIVMPSMGDPVAFDSKAANVIFCNPAGSVQALETALGGKGSGFNEPCPVQYASDGSLRAAYALQRPIIIPAVNITIKNGTLAVGNAPAWACLNIDWAKNVTVENVKFTYSSIADGNAGTGAQESEGVTFTGCDFGGRNCEFGGGAWNCSFVNCKNGNASIEEFSKGIVIQACTLNGLHVNDATCDFTLTRDTFVGIHPNFGSVAMTECGTGTIKDCTFADTVWVGGIAKGGSLTITGCTGPEFDAFNGSAPVKQGGNTFTKVSP